MTFGLAAFHSNSMFGFVLVFLCVAKRSASSVVNCFGFSPCSEALRALRGEMLFSLEQLRILIIKFQPRAFTIAVMIFLLLTF